MLSSAKIFFLAGLILAVYSVFSRFYGEPSVALTTFRSINLLIAANTLILIAIAINQFFRH